MKRVCIITPEYPPEQWGGLARTVQRVANHAKSFGCEVHVVHLSVKPDCLVLLDENRTITFHDGITIHRIFLGKERLDDSRDRDIWDCPHTLTLLMMYQSLEKLLRSERFDLLHSFFLYPVGYVTGLLARRFGIPTLATIVGNDVKKYIFSPEKVAVCRSGLENAERVAALSHDLVEMADALVPIREKARVIFNSVELPQRSWQPKKREDNEWIIGAGGIFKYAKGLPYLLKALAKLRASHPVRLELCGRLRPEEQKVFTHLIAHLKLEGRVLLREPLPHAEVFRWLSDLDVFVLPSVSEGCPNILMEALATGVPTVATRTGANEELVTHHSSGLLVPIGDSEALAEAIRELLDNAEQAQNFGAKARESMKNFSSERERAAWQKLYLELLEKE